MPTRSNNHRNTPRDSRRYPAAPQRATGSQRYPAARGDSSSSQSRRTNQQPPRPGTQGAANRNRPARGLTAQGRPTASGGRGRASAGRNSSGYARGTRPSGRSGRAPARGSAGGNPNQPRGGIDRIQIIFRIPMLKQQFLFLFGNLFGFFSKVRHTFVRTL